MAFVAGGQHDAENGMAASGVKLDDATMIANQFGNQRQSKAGSVGLGGDERVKQAIFDFFRYAGSVVLDAYFQWQ